jgi:hypothetical protein
LAVDVAHLHRADGRGLSAGETGLLIPNLGRDCEAHTL